nr:phage portal protein [uncultured Sphingomonas sp.]
MFNFFGRKSAVAEVRPHVPGFLLGEAQAGFPRGFEAQFEQVFRRNPVGQRVVRLLSTALAGLPIYDAGGVDAAARLVKAPGLLEAVTAGLLLEGNAYVKLLAGGDDVPAELYAMRPERVRVACDASGVASAYLLRAGGQVQRHARLDGRGRMQVVHLKALNPVDDLYGAGCMDAAIAAASIHNQASQWNKGLLDNAARPSGALTYEPADGAELSPKQFERLKDELSEQFAGAANAGRPLLLDGGLKWQALALSPADMDFVALKEGAARDIALAFGVPPVLVGLPGDATYANAREAGRALYRQTVLPMAGHVLERLSAMLSDWLGPVALRIDEDRISELAEDRARMWEVVSKADFLSRDEKRAQLGFNATEGQ